MAQWASSDEAARASLNSEPKAGCWRPTPSLPLAKLIPSSLRMTGGAPTQIGRYEVLERLGHGAFGEVYRGVHTVTKRQVALKMLRAGASERNAALLLREFELLKRAATQHPAFARVDELLLHEGRLVLARELVTGVELAQWQRGRPLAAVVDVYAVLAEALAALHRQQIAVRDLKPDNVLIDRNGDPRIVDFGLAVALDRPDELTADTLVGTPLYLAPEVWSGRPPDARSDVYALGVMLVEALSGESPAESRRNPRSTASVREVAVRTLTTGPNAQLERIAAGPAAQLVPRLRQMLSMEPVARPSAQDVAQALDAWLEGADVRARSAPQPSAAGENAAPTSLGPVELHAPRARSAPPGRSKPLVLAATAGTLVSLAVASWLTIGLDRLQPFVWASVFSVALIGFVLVARSHRSRERQSRAAALAAAPIEQRIRTLERRLDARNQVTRSIAVDVEDIASSFDERELERMLRRSVLVKLRERRDLDPVELMLALGYLREGLGRDERSAIERITPWVTLGGTGISALVAGVAFLTSTRLLVFDDPPRITGLRGSTAKIVAGGALDIEVAAEDPERRQLEYSYSTSAGTVTGHAKLATLRVPPGTTERVAVVRVVVRDPAGNTATEELVVRINHPPAGKLSFGSDLALGSRTRVRAEVRDLDGDALKFEWIAWPPVIPTGAADTVFWPLPADPGRFEIGCRVSDGTTDLVLHESIVLP